MGGIACAGQFYCFENMTLTPPQHPLWTLRVRKKRRILSRKCLSPTPVRKLILMPCMHRREKSEKSGEGAMRNWTDGLSEVLLGFYVIGWVVALVLTHMLSR